jgi:predicted O-methyltransferase YrrM
MDAPFPDGMLKDIEEFFALESTRPPGLDLYPSVFETALFFPLQRQAELAEMMREARRVSPRVVMEIGADKGGGLYHWCKCLPTVEEVVACEIRGLPYAGLFERNFKDLTFHWFPEPSLKAAFKVERALAGQKVDCLFIDGDKGAFPLDFAAYRPLMSPAGVVFMHDVQDRSPMRDAFLACKAAGYRTREIVDVRDYKASADRERHGHPPANAHEGWLRYWRGTGCGVGVIYMPEHPGFGGK